MHALLKIHVQLGVCLQSSFAWKSNLLKKSIFCWVHFLSFLHAQVSNSISDCSANQKSAACGCLSVKVMVGVEGGTYWKYTFGYMSVLVHDSLSPFFIFQFCLWGSFTTLCLLLFIRMPSTHAEIQAFPLSPAFLYLFASQQFDFFTVVFCVFNTQQAVIRWLMTLTHTQHMTNRRLIRSTDPHMNLWHVCAPCVVSFIFSLWLT